MNAILKPILDVICPWYINLLASRDPMKNHPVSLSYDTSHTITNEIHPDGANYEIVIDSKMYKIRSLNKDSVNHTQNLPGNLFTKQMLSLDPDGLCVRYNVLIMKLIGNLDSVDVGAVKKLSSADRFPIRIWAVDVRWFREDDAVQIYLSDDCFLTVVHC